MKTYKVERIVAVLQTVTVEARTQKEALEEAARSNYTLVGERIVPAMPCGWAIKK